jgi:Xaa-Pro aminopeptidase
VRIDDDVVVTKKGCEILSGGVPKTVAEIEALMLEARAEVA